MKIFAGIILIIGCIFGGVSGLKAKKWYQKLMGVFYFLGAFCICTFLFDDSSASDDDYYYYEESTSHGGSNPSFRGKVCDYTVGCSCTGFKPITDGTVADQSICKTCKHPKSYHD